jgi:hypothetical protein
MCQRSRFRQGTGKFNADRLIPEIQRFSGNLDCAKKAQETADLKLARGVLGSDPGTVRESGSFYR